MLHIFDTTGGLFSKDTPGGAFLYVLVPDVYSLWQRTTHFLFNYLKCLSMTIRISFLQVFPLNESVGRPFRCSLQHYKVCT